jgi:hypothetical protein
MGAETEIISFIKMLKCQLIKVKIFILKINLTEIDQPYMYVYPFGYVWAAELLNRIILMNSHLIQWVSWHLHVHICKRSSFPLHEI